MGWMRLLWCWPTPITTSGTFSRPMEHDLKRCPGLRFVEALAGLAPQYAALRRPWLGPYRSSDHSFLFPDCPKLRSIAMIPISHQRTLLGSINFGSADTARFTREYATDFFAHLGSIASFALENAVNRARLLRSGFTDVLTGWHNRRYLQVRLQEELARARRDGSTLVCLMLDFDHFKDVNDTHGHAAGDTALRELTRRIENSGASKRHCSSIRWRGIRCPATRHGYGGRGTARRTHFAARFRPARSRLARTRTLRSRYRLVSQSTRPLQIRKT